VREKATIDHLAQDVYKPKPTEKEHHEHNPTTSSGLPVEDQVRRNGIPAKVACPFSDENLVYTIDTER
jgi:hypothetical protein